MGGQGNIVLNPAGAAVRPRQQQPTGPIDGTSPKRITGDQKLTGAPMSAGRRAKGRDSGERNSAEFAARLGQEL